MALIALPTFFVSSTSASENIDTTVNVEPSLTLSVSANTLNLNLDPSSVTFGYNDLDVMVGTNNETGYKLTMSTTSTNLVNTEDTNVVIETLPTLAGGYTDSTFIVNKWGYKKNRNTDNYNSFPLTETLLENSTRTNEDVANLRFATKIDYLQESGTYTTAISFNAVVNPICDTTITGDMQTFDPCPDMAIGTSGTLKDLRDNKVYTVAKLADGQIWMTSNLNLAGGTKLYSETSDVPAGYPTSGGVGYYQLPASSSSGFSNNSTAYVYNTGNETTLQSDCSPSCNSYYSWLAAVAGNQTNATTNGTDAPYSICPKGWRLPKSGNRDIADASNASSYKNGDLYKLATAYGANLESSYIDNSSTFYNNAGPGTIPNFLLSGWYRGSTFIDSYGSYWASTAYYNYSAIPHTYAIGIRSNILYSPDLFYIRDGGSVRCLFRG